MIFGPSKKIYLTSVEHENIEQLRQWRNDPELRKYFREHREISKEMQEKWFQEKVLGDPNQINFEIHEANSKKLIGHCGLYYIKWVNGTGEFGIYLGESRRCGYGTDALKALLNYGFYELGLTRIWCEVYENNRAIDTYKKIGFKHEGTLRKHIFKEGKHLDAHMLGLLREEWDKMYYGTEQVVEEIKGEINILDEAVKKAISTFEKFVG